VESVHGTFFPEPSREYISLVSVQLTGEGVSFLIILALEFLQASPVIHFNPSELKKVGRLLGQARPGIIGNEPDKCSRQCCGA
jgi:hypothetical protein